MKNIHTSNFARNGDKPNAIAISCTVPKWYNGKHYKSLAPEWSMVDAVKKDQMTREQYAVFYLDLLTERGITPEKVLAMIPDNSILLCYESPNNFCHRRVLADWVKDKTGVEIPEWKNEKEQDLAQQEALVDSMLDF